MRYSCLLINLFPGRHYDSQSRETSSLKLFSWRLVLWQEIVQKLIKSFNTIFENTIKSLQIYLGQADIDKISLWIVTSAIISDCNWTRTHNHLVHKRTLDYLIKLAFNNWAVLWVLICTVHLTAYSYHVTYAF